jgi:hypothetical protein
MERQVSVMRVMLESCWVIVFEGFHLSPKKNYTEVKGLVTASK